MELRDLHVRVLDQANESDPIRHRPASVVDLVAALIAEGGEIQATSIANVSEVALRILLVDGTAGRYLVYGPIPVEGEIP